MKKKQTSRNKGKSFRITPKAEFVLQIKKEHNNELKTIFSNSKGFIWALFFLYLKRDVVIETREFFERKKEGFVIFYLKISFEI